MVYTRALSVDIFDRVINHWPAAASSNEPLLCNEFSALRLIVSHVRSIPSLSLCRKGLDEKEVLMWGLYNVQYALLSLLSKHEGTRLL